MSLLNTALLYMYCPTGDVEVQIIDTVAFNLVDNKC